MTSGQIVPTLPLYAVAGIHGWIERAAWKRSLGDLIPDRVFRGNEKQNFALKVYSCRPKSHWNSYIMKVYSCRPKSHWNSYITIEPAPAGRHD